MKKILAILLTALLVISLAACGGEQPAQTDSDKAEAPQQAASEPTAPSTESESSENEPSGADSSPWLTTKTGRFYSQYANGMYMEYETEYDGMVMTIVTATHGDKTYSETTMDGQSMGVSIMDGEDIYTIDHANKMVIKMSLQTSGQEVMDTMIEEGDVDPANLISGTREIDGKTYDTEEWSLDGAKSILCFDGDDLAYIIGEFDGEEVVIKVLKTSNEVDDSLFELPEDYEVMSY